MTPALLDRRLFSRDLRAGRCSKNSARDDSAGMDEINFRPVVREGVDLAVAQLDSADRLTRGVSCKLAARSRAYEQCAL